MEKAVILADDKSNSWNFALETADKIFKKYGEKAEVANVEISRFPDGEVYAYIPKNLRQKRVFFIHDSSKEPDKWLSELLVVNDAISRASSEAIIDVLPYLRFSRQDRKDKPHVPITARLVADAISLRAARVITTDLHAAQIQGFYNIPVDTLQSFPYAVSYLKQNYPEFIQDLVVVSPDVGGTVRARAFAKRLGCDISIIDKRRKDAENIEEMRIVGELKKNVLIVDDIISTGSTICKAAKLLKEKGVEKIYVYSTHGIFCNSSKPGEKTPEQKLKEFVDKIIVTDSIPVKRDGVEVVSLTDLYAEAIYRAQKGLSISELFD